LEQVCPKKGTCELGEKIIGKIVGRREGNQGVLVNCKGMEEKNSCGKKHRTMTHDWGGKNLRKSKEKVERGHIGGGKKVKAELWAGACFKNTGRGISSRGRGVEGWENKERMKDAKTKKGAARLCASSLKRQGATRLIHSIQTKLDPYHMGGKRSLLCLGVGQKETGEAWGHKGEYDYFQNSPRISMPSGGAKCTMGNMLGQSQLLSLYGRGWNPLEGKKKERGGVVSYTWTT